MKKILLLALTLFVFVACAPASAVNLNGEWKLVSYGDAADPTPALPGVDAYLTFKDGQMNGNVGCNGFGGSYELKGGKLTFSGVMSTMMYCEATANQEQTVLSIFADGVSLGLQMDGKNLTITSPDGASVVNLARK